MTGPAPIDRPASAPVVVDPAPPEGVVAEVTIGMPVLNNARTLERAIGSVLDQRLQAWRLIISDDGSTDGSDRIAEAAALADPRISVLRQPVRLGYMNFRAPLDQARTPWFAWLAADDHWHPDFLGLTLQALKAAPAAVSAVPQAAYIGDPPRPIRNLGFLKGNAGGRIARYLAYPGGTRMYGLMRTEALRQAFPPRPFHAYDWYLMVALLGQGPQLSLPQTLLYREETPWWAYAAGFAAERHPWPYRSFPVLEMSLQLLRDRRLPLSALPKLIRLNLHKHEEIIALDRPGLWQRRRWLYRRMHLSVARSPEQQAELAARRAGLGASAAPAVAPVSAPALVGEAALATAIVTFRNAEATLERALQHLTGLGCRVIAIDHGSTDASRDIAASARVARLIDTPWTGTFDLGRQLALKAQIIKGLPRGWVLHADADEFLDPPEDLPLADCLDRARADGRLAFACDEELFLPGFEDEEHDPQHFVETLTTSVLMRERDAKQRLFHSDADLGLWLRTAGHTVTRDPGQIAETRLRLRHYPGLSLDHLRAQYHARVFAPEDRARLWHGNRMIGQVEEVVEPDPALFQGPELASVPRLPFLSQTGLAPQPRLPEAVDLFLLGGHPGAERQVKAALPGLRIAQVQPPALSRMTRMVPVLHVVTHPAVLHGPGVQRSLERRRACDWTRAIAQARQWAAERNAAYLELRSEDGLDDPEALLSRLTRLWQPPILRGTAGFLAPDAPVVTASPWENPVRAITRPLAADLGYR